jgi:spermidine synthase
MREPEADRWSEAIAVFYRAVREPDGSSIGIRPSSLVNDQPATGYDLAIVPSTRAADWTRIAAPGLLLFLSGAAALVYQLLWIKQLSLVVGVDVYAVTTGVSAFFGGLAIGSAAFGRRAESSRQPLRLYAVIEIGVAVLGVGATIALAHSAAAFAALDARSGWLAWALPFALVGAPATLMGGTLPVLARAASPASDAIGRAGGWLYAANTAGAIAGALLVPFVLIPTFGVRGSALSAGALNLITAITALALERLNSRTEDAALPRPVEATPASQSDSRRRQAGATRGDGAVARATHGRDRGTDARRALQLYALSGSIALGYEVVWSQAIVQFVSTRAFAFAIVLATYLAALAIGSAFYARIADRVRDPWGIFGLFIAAAGLVALLEMAVLGPWLMTWQSELEEAVRHATSSELAAMSARFLGAALGLVFVPTLLLGAAWPAALRLAVDATRVGRDTGVVMALNIAGGIAGTMLTGFVLVPAFGIIRSLGLLGIAAAVIGLIAVHQRTGVRRVVRSAMFGVAAATLAVGLLTPEDRIARLLTLTRSGGELLFYAESAGGTVAVVEQASRNARFRRLYIQGVSNSGDALTSVRYMRLQALLPLIVHRGNPRSALVIGLGTGITAGALLRYPGLERRVCAELLPAVVQAAPLFRGNFGALSDPRLHVRLRDGRRELLRSEEQYDVITLEPPPPSAAGVVNLYSRDFYELARARLRPDGLLAQWWPLPTQNDEDSRSIVRSFLDAFPYASVWTTELHEMLLLGSANPIELDAARITTRFEQPDVSRALSEVGIGSPAELLATWITDRASLERYAAAAPAVTDNRPGIEYATWTRPGELTRVLPAVLSIATPPPVTNADAAQREAIAAERARLVTFYRSGLAAIRGDRETAALGLRQVVRDAPTNPYYRWFVTAE